MGATTTATNESHGSDEMKGLAVSYMGKPLHFLSSFLLALLSRMLTFLFSRKKRADTRACPVSPTSRQPLVRLKNLPQVCVCLVILPGWRVLCFLSLGLLLLAGRKAGLLSYEAPSSFDQKYNVSSRQQSHHHSAQRSAFIFPELATHVLQQQHRQTKYIQQ